MCFCWQFCHNHSPFWLLWKVRLTNTANISILIIKSSSTSLGHDLITKNGMIYLIIWTYAIIAREQTFWVLTDGTVSKMTYYDDHFTLMDFISTQSEGSAVFEDSPGFTFQQNHCINLGKQYVKYLKLPRTNQCLLRLYVQGMFQAPWRHLIEDTGSKKQGFAH